MDTLELKSELSARQQKALAHLKNLPAPRVPDLNPSFLRQPPLSYRLLPLSMLVPAGLLVFFLIQPFILIPDSWQGASPFKSDSVIELAVGTNTTLALPRSQGVLMLQGPARLEASHLGHQLFSSGARGALRLEYGTLLFDAHTGIRKEILIQTPLLQIRVTGTQFTLSHHPDHGTRLGVVQGTVFTKSAAEGSADWQMLKAGNELIVTPQGFVAQQPLSSQESPNQSFGFPRNQSDDQQSPRFIWHEEN